MNIRSNLPKKAQKFPRLLYLTSNEIKTLRDNGIHVPLQDFDMTKVDFQVFLNGWSVGKKLAFAKSVLNSIGITCYKGDDGKIYFDNNGVIEHRESQFKLTESEVLTVREPEELEQPSAVEEQSIVQMP